MNQEKLLDMSNDKILHADTIQLIQKLGKYDYTYNFNWLGIPIIQCPQDMEAMQELI